MHVRSARWSLPTDLYALERLCSSKLQSPALHARAPCPTVWRPVTRRCCAPATCPIILRLWWTGRSFGPCVGCRHLSKAVTSWASWSTRKERSSSATMAPMWACRCVWTTHAHSGCSLVCMGLWLSWGFWAPLISGIHGPRQTPVRPPPRHTPPVPWAAAALIRSWTEACAPPLTAAQQGEQPQIHQSASRSHLRSHQAVGLGLTSAPSVTRTWWTQSSTPVDTCVSATPVASNSRKCPTPAVPSAEGRSKTSSRPTGARKGTTANRRPPYEQQNPRVKSQSQGKRCLNSRNIPLVLWFGIFVELLSVDLFRSWYRFIGMVSFTLELLSEPTCGGSTWSDNENLILARGVCSLLGSWKTLKEREKLNQFENDFICWAMLYSHPFAPKQMSHFGAECLSNNFFRGWLKLWKMTCISDLTSQKSTPTTGKYLSMSQLVSVCYWAALRWKREVSLASQRWSDGSLLSSWWLSVSDVFRDASRWVY